MNSLRFDELDPNELKIDPLNERASNVSPHSSEGESLQNSVEKLGVLEPVVVREANGEYLVVAGQRRTLAAQTAEVETIPVRVMEMTDSEARLASITENAEIYKKDVPEGDRAASIKQLVDDGYDPSEIAEEMGATEQTIRRWLEPALPDWADTKFDPESDNGDVGPEDISLELMQIIRRNTTGKEHREDLATKVLENNLTIRQVRDASNKSNSDSEFETLIDRTIEDAESEIDPVSTDVYFSGDEAEKIDAVMKDRGMSEQKVIEDLVKQSLSQIYDTETDSKLAFDVSEETTQALENLTEGRDASPNDLSKTIVKRKLEEYGYLDNG